MRVGVCSRKCVCVRVSVSVSVSVSVGGWRVFPRVCAKVKRIHIGKSAHTHLISIFKYKHTGVSLCVGGVCFRVCVRT